MVKKEQNHVHEPPAQLQKNFMYLPIYFTTQASWIGNLSRTTLNWFRGQKIENILLKKNYFTSFLFHYFRCWKIHRARQRALWLPWGRICNWRSKGNSHRSQVSSTFKMKIFWYINGLKYKKCQLFFRDANSGSVPFTFGGSGSVPSYYYDSHGRQLHPCCGQPSPYGLLCAF